MTGLRGRDGLHTWTSPDDLTLTLNEIEDTSTGALVSPRYRIVEVVRGLASAGDSYDKRVGQAGTIPRADYRGSTLHTYTIEVYGETIDEFNEGEETLRAAFYDQSAEGRMDVNRHPLNPSFDADDNRYFNAKALGLDPVGDDPEGELSPQLGFRREWVLVLRNHDGRYFEDAEGEEATITDTNTEYPFA